MKKIKVFTTMGVKGLNTFVEDNAIDREDIINIETVIDVETTGMKYVNKLKKKTFKLWYWGTEEDSNEKWNRYETTWA